VVSNHAGGLIDGTRHGITGDNPVTVTNEANGVIKGEAGSGINLDTASDTTTTITNHGSSPAMQTALPTVTVLTSTA
jgi:hypothetical protein